MNLLKKYWDIFGGFVTGIALSFAASFKLERIQLIYSIIILILVSIGIFKIIKQTIDNGKAKREKNLIDDMVDAQKSIKAIKLAQDPTKDGEELGKLILDLGKGKTMKKFKEVFDKIKGYLFAIALGILTIIEYCGGFINDICNDALVIGGVEIIPIITLGSAIVVGMLSNGYTKEQREKIKLIINGDATQKNALVTEEIKQTIKTNEALKKAAAKELSAKESELTALEKELATAQEKYKAKLELKQRLPEYTNDADVQVAEENVRQIEVKILTIKNEIEQIKAKIENYEITIKALKTQL